MSDENEPQPANLWIQNLLEWSGIVRQKRARQCDGGLEKADGRRNVETQPGPDFLLLGAMKSGTTSLFHYIGQHPDMLMPSSKEIHYYDRYRYSGWSLDNYLNEFPEKPAGKISGEATPFYLRHPHAPAWVVEDFPDVSLIALLRNPVDRAYSHYVQRFQKGKESEDFLSLVQREEADTAESWSAWRADPETKVQLAQKHSFLSRGRYAEQIEAWLAHFAREDLHVLFAEDLLANPDRELDAVFSHLGLEPIKVDFGRKLNRRRYEPMSAEARIWLEDYFAPQNAALADLLERDLPPSWQSGS